MKARDIMTVPVITIGPDAPVRDIAALLFETRGIKRVPVLRRKKLVGIVSRANLVQALAVEPKNVGAQGAQTDDVIRKRLLTEVAHQSWWRRSLSNVIVTDGVVHYWGLL